MRTTTENPSNKYQEQTKPIRNRITAGILTMFCICGALMFAGCSSTKHHFGELDSEQAAPSISTTAVTLTNRIDPHWLMPPTNQFTLGPGDQLEIELIGDTNSFTRTMVCPDGKVYFNVLSGVDVWGLTLPEAKQRLEQELAQQIRNEPRVTISLRAVQSKRVWLLGRVQSPGVYPLNGPTTLLEAIAGAGGTLSLIGQRDIPLSTAVEELADLPRSFIIRRGKVLPVDFDRLMNKGDLSQNIYLEPDDFVYMPPGNAKDVYVMGAVAQPRSVPYTENLTLVGAIAASYGTIKESYESHVAVLRGSLAQPQMTVVNFNAIQHGREPDIPLQPHDIVFVPFSPYRYIERFAEVVVNTFASSVAINAGSNLVLKKPLQPAGVFIPVGSRITVLPPLPPVQ